MNKIKNLSILILVITSQILALSGPITTNTTWSSDVILTGNTTVNAGVTLTIAAGVKVEPVWLDNNADGIGDITFTVSGILASQGTSGNPVVFQSYDRKNSRQSWMGMVFSGPKQTVTGMKIKNAWRGLTVTAASDTNTFSSTAIDSCLDGVYLDATNDSTRFNTLAIRYCRYGMRPVNAGGIRGTDVDINRNDSGGILLNASAAIFENAVVYTNGVFGIKTITSGIMNLTKSTITGNYGYGIFVDTGTVANVSLCNIVNNDKLGVLVFSKKIGALNINSSNLFGNAASLSTIPDNISIGQLGFTGDMNGASFKVPTFIYRIQSTATGDEYAQNSTITIGAWSTGNRTPGIYLDTFSTSFTSENLGLSGTRVWDGRSNYHYSGVSINSFSFTHAYQLLYLTPTNNIITATDNWWGQFTNIDTLIGTQTLVTWSGYRTESVPGAGSTNSTQRITVSKLSHTFANTAVTFSDSVKLTITNSGGTILRLDSIGTQDTCFKIRRQKSAIAGGEYDTVTVTFRPVTATAYSTYLNILTNDPTQPLVQIYLSGTGIPYNFRPRFMVRPSDTLCIAGDAFTRTVTAQDSNLTDVLTYSLPRKPTGMSIAPLTGVIIWSPALAAVTDSVFVVVADQLGLTDTCKFKLTVAHRPIFTTASPADTLINAGATWDFDVNASDADNHAFVFSLDSLRGNMMISSSSGLIHYVPAVADTGRFAVMVRATDPLGAFATQKFFLRVRSTGTVTNPNLELPVLAHNFGQVRVTTRAYLPLMLRNTGTATLTVDSIRSTVSRMSVNWSTRQVAVSGVETLFVYFDPDSIKSYSGFLNIYSNDPQKRLVQFQISGQGTLFNTSPNFTRLQADTVLNAGMSVAFPGLAADSTPGDTIVYSLQRAPTGMTINAFTGAIAWTTVSNTPSTGVVVRVTDKYSATVTDSFYIKVNHMPVINTVFPADTNLVIGHAYNFPVTATDPDGDRLTFSLDSAIAGMVIDANTGTIIVAPTTTAHRTVYVRVRDSLGMTSTVPFVVTISNTGIRFGRTLPKTFGVSSVYNAQGIALQIVVPLGAAARKVDLTVLNLQGKTLVEFSGTYAPGWNLVPLDRAVSAGGIYLIKIRSQDYIKTIRCVQQ